MFPQTKEKKRAALSFPCTGRIGPENRWMDVSWIEKSFDGWRAMFENLAATGRGFHSHHHLLAAKQGVADELASSQGNGSVVIRHGCGVVLLVSEEKCRRRDSAVWRRGRSWEKGLDRKTKTGAAKIPKHQSCRLVWVASPKNCRGVCVGLCNAISYEN